MFPCFPRSCSCSRVCFYVFHKLICTCICLWFKVLTIENKQETEQQRFDLNILYIEKATECKYCIFIALIIKMLYLFKNSFSIRSSIWIKLWILCLIFPALHTWIFCGLEEANTFFHFGLTRICFPLGPKMSQHLKTVASMWNEVKSRHVTPSVTHEPLFSLEKDVLLQLFFLLVSDWMGWNAFIF